LIPLSAQAVAELRELGKLTGHGQFVFPSLLTGERCMSENTVNTALRRMGLRQEPDDCPRLSRDGQDDLVEQLNVHPDVIEAQLAHGKSGPLGSAYDRAEFMEQRRSMMQSWADYLGSVDIRVNNTAPTRCSGWRRHAKAASRWTVETNRGLAAGQGWRSWAQRDGQPHVRRSGAVDCPHGQSLA
jgi:hypothetical protein